MIKSLPRVRVMPPFPARRGTRLSVIHFQSARELARRIADGEVSSEALRQEREYIASIDSIYDLLAEQQILREAVELATASQRKTISSMMKTIERRMDEIEEDEAVIVLLT